jgi:hypothetical protein
MVAMIVGRLLDVTNQTEINAFYFRFRGSVPKMHIALQSARVCALTHVGTVEEVEGDGIRTAIVRTAWIIENGTDFPRLVSCYVK